MTNLHNVFQVWENIIWLSSEHQGAQHQPQLQLDQSSDSPKLSEWRALSAARWNCKAVLPIDECVHSFAFLNSSRPWGILWSNEYSNHQCKTLLSRRVWREDRDIQQCVAYPPEQAIPRLGIQNTSNVDVEASKSCATRTIYQLLWEGGLELAQ